MAPASASLLPAATSSIAGAKRPATAAVSAAEAPLLPQDGVGAGKNQSQGQQQQLECPRCMSRNTKFCYYNNYSTTQPRHFCRACRRYWTHGGTLRKVPVGGACRRSAAGNKRRRAGSPSAETSPSSGSPAVDAAYRSDIPAATPFFPFLSDGAVFLPQFDLGLGGAASATFPWTPASVATDNYHGLAAPWGAGGAWDDFATGLELTWPPPGADN